MTWTQCVEVAQSSYNGSWYFTFTVHQGNAETGLIENIQCWVFKFNQESVQNEWSVEGRTEKDYPHVHRKVPRLQDCIGDSLTEDGKRVVQSLLRTRKENLENPESFMCEVALQESTAIGQWAAGIQNIIFQFRQQNGDFIGKRPKADTLVLELGKCLLEQSMRLSPVYQESRGQAILLLSFYRLIHHTTHLRTEEQINNFKALCYLINLDHRELMAKVTSDKTRPHTLPSTESLLDGSSLGAQQLGEPSLSSASQTHAQDTVDSANTSVTGTKISQPESTSTKVGRSVESVNLVRMLMKELQLSTILNSPEAYLSKIAAANFKEIKQVAEGIQAEATNISESAPTWTSIVKYIIGKDQKDQTDIVKDISHATLAGDLLVLWGYFSCVTSNPEGKAAKKLAQPQKYCMELIWNHLHCNRTTPFSFEDLTEKLAAMINPTQEQNLWMETFAEHRELCCAIVDEQAGQQRKGYTWMKMVLGLQKTATSSTDPETKANYFAYLFILLHYLIDRDMMGNSCWSTLEEDSERQFALDLLETLREDKSWSMTHALHTTEGASTESNADSQTTCTTELPQSGNSIVSQAETSPVDNNSLYTAITSPPSI